MSLLQRESHTHKRSKSMLRSWSRALSPQAGEENLGNAVDRQEHVRLANLYFHSRCYQYCKLWTLSYNLILNVPIDGQVEGTCSFYVSYSVRFMQAFVIQLKRMGCSDRNGKHNTRRHENDSESESESDSPNFNANSTIMTARRIMNEMESHKKTYQLIMWFK